MRRTAIALAVLLVLLLVGLAFGSSLVMASGKSVNDNSEKHYLDRDDVYYDIRNDNGDFGNYIETYHVPNGRGGFVYCLVYSDKIGDGGGAGMDCDWGHPTR